MSYQRKWKVVLIRRDDDQKTFPPQDEWRARKRAEALLELHGPKARKIEWRDIQTIYIDAKAYYQKEAR